jgi:acetyl-CoA C-acetyltransferase
MFGILSRSFSSAATRGGEAVVLSAARTPIGAYGGALSALSGVQLGSIAISAALQRSNVSASDVSEVLMGNVLSASLGQAPATQAATAAGIPNSVPSWSINKVCSSGLKAFQLAAAGIRSGDQSVVIAGGFESMSNVPHYLARARSAFPYGSQEMQDGVLRDGLLDAYEPGKHMGNCAEKCAAEYKITRQQQDAYGNAWQRWQRARLRAIALT